MAPRVIAAPCAMKGVRSARALAAVIARGVRRRRPECDVRELPIADGGEGTVDALAAHVRVDHVACVDVMGAPVRAPVAFLDDGHALVECATVLGLPQVPDVRHAPLGRSSSALVPLVEHALARGARRISFAIGGTATVDGGRGLLAGLGARFLDDTGAPLAPDDPAAALARVDLVPALARLAGAEVRGLVDVTSPLVGPEGARLFMAQKGVDAVDEARVEAALARLVDAAGRADVKGAAGAGAGGGLGAAVLLLGGALEGGADFVLDHAGVDDALTGAALVLTAEGRFDAQTAHGKAIWALGRRAQAHGVPVIALCGERAWSGAARELPATVVSIARGPMTREVMMTPAETDALVEELAFELAGLLPPT